MTSLPSLEAILACPSDAQSPLAHSLALLFEPSPILTSALEPEVSALIASVPPASYIQLIEIALTAIKKWPEELQAQFIAGHPRIGESKNLSTLSAKEQGATLTTSPTPPEVLIRLAHLNACFEHRYPGLRYITFVNGRSRAAIAEEMEGRLGLCHSLSANDPEISSMMVLDVGSKEWLVELRRAVDDIGKIAKSRLAVLEAK